MPDRRVTLAAILGAHGVTGEVRLKLFAESLDSFRALGSFDADGRALTLKAVRSGGKKGIVARFAEITDRNAAEALRGTTLSVARAALPGLDAGEFYAADLVGLPVVCDGAEIGSVFAVENYGAGDILEIEKPGGKRFMVPFSREAVPEVGDALTLDPVFLPS